MRIVREKREIEDRERREKREREREEDSPTCRAWAPSCAIRDTPTQERSREIEYGLFPLAEPGLSLENDGFIFCSHLSLSPSTVTRPFTLRRADFSLSLFPLKGSITSCVSHSRSYLYLTLSLSTSITRVNSLSHFRLSSLNIDHLSLSSHKLIV